MALVKLDQSEIDTAAADLSSGQLRETHVEDIHSIFRQFLGKKLSADYTLLATLEALDDSVSGEKAAKLVACLNRLNDLDFDETGFAPTSSNRSGFVYSNTTTEFKIVKYMFGLLWDIPDEIENRFNRNSSGSKSAVIDIKPIFVN